jgi:O-antigen ligase
MPQSAPTFNRGLQAFLLIGIGLLPLFQWPDALDAGLNSRQLLLGLLTVGLTSMAFIQERKRLEKSKIPLIGVVAISWWLWGWIPHISALSTADSLNIGLRNGSLVGLFLLVILALKNNVIDRKTIVRAGFYFGLITAGHAFFEILKAVFDGSFQESVYNITGLFQHKNLLSGALLISLPFAFLATTEGNGWEKKGALILSIVLLLELFMLRTRGAWLGIIGAGIMTIPIAWVMGGEAKKSLKLLLRWWPALIVVLAVLVFSVSRETAGSQLLNERNISHRFAFWENTLEMFKEHPITGVGNGNWRIYFPKYGLENTDTQVMNGITGIQRPHNDYLWILSEQGLIGLILFLGILGLAKWHLFRREKPQSIEEAKSRLIIWFGFIAFCLFAFGDFPYERSAHMAMFFLLLALMSHEGAELPSLKLPAIPMLLLFGGVAVGSAIVSRQRLQSEEDTKLVHQYNAQQNKLIIKAAKDAESDYYHIDNFTNPLPYYAALGEIYLAKDLKAAEANLNRALELHPWHILSLNQFGNLYKQQKKWGQAENYFDQALALSPEFEMARLNKAEALIEKEKWDEAFLWMHGCALKSKNRKIYLMASKILPPWVESKVSNPSAQKPPILKALLPFRGDTKAMVNAYGEYRRNALQQAQRARGLGENN